MSCVHVVGKTLYFAGMADTALLYLDPLLNARFESRQKRVHKARKFVVEDQRGEIPRGHTHPVAAAERNSMSAEVVRLASELGVTRLFDFCGSPRVARAGGVGIEVDGFRDGRTDKDLSNPLKMYSGQTIDGVSMIDVSYYVTLDRFKPFAGLPIIISGLCPTEISGKHGENSYFSFISKDVVREEVSGGAVYEHKVYDFSVEQVRLPGYWLWQCVYDVIRIQTPPAWNKNRALVALVPCCWVSPIRRVVEWFTPSMRGKMLDHMKVGETQRHLFGVFGPPTAKRVEILPRGMYGARATVVPMDVHMTLEFQSNRSKGGMLLVEYCGNSMRKLADDGLYEGQRDLAHITNLATFYSNPFGELVEASSYEAVRKEYEATEAPTNTEVIAPGLVTPGVYPTASEPNEVQGVEERVEEPRNLTPKPLEYAEYIEEYAELVRRRAQRNVTGGGGGVLYDDDTVGPVPQSVVEANQRRPAQRARTERQIANDAFGAGPGTGSGFGKMDCNATAKAQRVITNTGPDHLRTVAPIVYAVTDELKKLAFWMPGKTPSQLDDAINVAAVRCVELGTELVGADASKMDARVAPWMHDMVVDIIGDIAAPEVRKGTKDELMREKGMKFKMMKSKRAFRVTGTASGSPITTQKNTLVTGMTSYVTNRVSGDAQEEAFVGICPLFGDDVTVRKDRLETFISVGAKMGMKFEPEVAPGGVGLVFLSRHYIDPAGSPCSVPMVRRALSKMPTCRGATREERLRHLQAKVTAALACDPEVPVFSDYALALTRVFKKEFAANRVSWDRLEREDPELVYKYRAEGKAFRVYDPALAKQSVMLQLEVTEKEIDHLVASLKRATIPKHINGLRMLLERVDIPDADKFLMR